MAILDKPNADFNRVYQVDLDTLNSRIYLQFDRKNQWKRLNQIAIDGASLVNNAWQAAVNDEIMAPIIIIRGYQNTFLSGAVAFPSPVLGAGNFQGDLIQFWYENLRFKTNPVTYSPPLLVEPDQTLSITFLRPFTSLTGASVNTRLVVTVFGEYIPRRAGADLSKETYLNVPTAL